MKKYILAVLMMLFLNTYADQLDPDQYRDKFSYEKYTGLWFCAGDPIKAVRLINKIESTCSESKKEILLTMLEMELENLEDRINEYISLIKESIESITVVDEASRKDNEAMINKNHESLQVISEWRLKYLRPE